MGNHILNDLLLYSIRLTRFPGDFSFQDNLHGQYLTILALPRHMASLCKAAKAVGENLFFNNSRTTKATAPAFRLVNRAQV